MDTPEKLAKRAHKAKKNKTKTKQYGLDTTKLVL